mmetsp:Transcript_26366/g.55112  ORF Transcript_26366/g.55112 Transcript_26366/m.55112 type:complete len:136 (-) Transcript_26366:6-413(-)
MGGGMGGRSVGSVPGSRGNSSHGGSHDGGGASGGGGLFSMGTSARNLLFGSSAPTADANDGAPTRPPTHVEERENADDDADDASLDDYKEALNRKKHDMNQVVWKMNEFMIAAKTYQSKLEGREDHVLYLEQSTT